MKRIKFILLAITMMLAAPAFLTSCQEDAPEINYTMNVSVINDFTKVVEAINNGFLKNEEAIKQLTAAIDKMNADQQTKLQAVIDVLNSVNATLETKLTAIEAAMKAQTLSLENKLSLLETAVKNQTLKQEEMAGKLATAIESLQGSMEEKMEAITEAINNANTTLETKLDLIEAAMKAQTLSLEGKLDLLETAIKNLPDYTKQLEAIKAVIESLPDYGDKLDALTAAITALPDYTSQLEAIKTAIEALPDYGDKLTALENAIKALPDYSDKFDAVANGLYAIKTQIEELGTVQTDIATKISEVTTAINNLIAEVNSGNTSAAAALAQIIQKLEELKAAIGSGGGGTTPSTMEYVDLGLPSGTMWAKCNLGASNPEDYGGYYAWGETNLNKSEYTWDTYRWGTKDNLTKYCLADGKTTLDPEDDVATYTLHSPWRMPTVEDFEELKNNCTCTWITQDGVRGYEVKGPNGNIIFLPAAGYRAGSKLSGNGSMGGYWSSLLLTASSDAAHLLLFDSGEFDSGNGSREFGFSVRPVRGGTPTSTVEYVDLGLPSGLKWAKCNLGATKPADYGDHYAWGETEPKADYSWATYQWGTEDNLTKYNATDGKTTLDAADDAATAKLGSPWRMPTADEITELLDKCTWTLTWLDDVRGYEVKGPNDNAIFLPMTGVRTGPAWRGAGLWGDYSSRSLDVYDSSKAFILGIAIKGNSGFYYHRDYGYSVRPVRP